MDDDDFGGFEVCAIIYLIYVINCFKCFINHWCSWSFLDHFECNSGIKKWNTEKLKYIPSES